MSSPPSSKPSTVDGSLARLEVSRGRMRAALLQIAHPPKPPPLLSHGIGGLGDALTRRAKALPGAAVLMEGVSHWWQDHPLHRALDAAGPAAAPVMGDVAKVARKNPRAAFLTGVGLGLVVIFTPWRRVAFKLLRPALFSGILLEVGKAALRSRVKP